MNRIVRFKVGQDTPDGAIFLGTENHALDDQDDPIGLCATMYETVYVYSVPEENIRSEK